MIAACILVLWVFWLWTRSSLTEVLDVGRWADNPVPSARLHVLALSGFV